MWLKQSTAVTIKLGPFVNDTDGKTAETGLTIAQADVRLSKNGGDMAQKNESSSATHDELGYYDTALNTTDVATLGRLKAMVHKSGALPVFAEFMVVPANVWDSLFGADYLQVDLAQVLGATADLMEDEDVAAAVLAAEVPSTNDAGTVADCLNAARAQGFGRWVLNSVGNTLTVYGSDDTTPVKVFTIGPDLDAPLTRTPV